MGKRHGKTLEREWARSLRHAAKKFNLVWRRWPDSQMFYAAGEREQGHTPKAPADFVMSFEGLFILHECKSVMSRRTASIRLERFRQLKEMTEFQNQGMAVAEWIICDRRKPLYIVAYIMSNNLLTTIYNKMESEGRKSIPLEYIGEFGYELERIKDDDGKPCWDLEPYFGELFKSIYGERAWEKKKRLMAQRSLQAAQPTPENTSTQSESTTGSLSYGH